MSTNGQIVYGNAEPHENNRAAGQPHQSGVGSAQVDFGGGIGNFGTRDFTIAYWMKTDSKYRHEAFLAKRPSCDSASSFLDIQVGSGGNSGGRHSCFAPG